MQTDTNSVEYQRAKKRVKKLRGFYEHLFVYLVVNTGLFLLNILTSPGHYWFIWPLLGWGIGLAMNAVAVFGRGTAFGEEWEEKKIKEILDKKNQSEQK